MIDTGKISHSSCGLDGQFARTQEEVKNRKLLAKQREYLQHVFKVEGEYPTSARLREIADLTGISVKSLRNWFGHVRLEKDRILKS